jgi:hypothetical protein
MKAYSESAEVLAETDRAIDLLRLAFPARSGLHRPGHGLSIGDGNVFEDEQMKALQSEFEAPQEAMIEIGNRKQPAGF